MFPNDPIDEPFGIPDDDTPQFEDEVPQHAVDIGRTVKKIAIAYAQQGGEGYLKMSGSPITHKGKVMSWPGVVVHSAGGKEPQSVVHFSVRVEDGDVFVNDIAPARSVGQSSEDFIGGLLASRFKSVKPDIDAGTLTRPVGLSRDEERGWVNQGFEQGLRVNPLSLETPYRKAMARSRMMPDLNEKGRAPKFNDDALYEQMPVDPQDPTAGMERVKTRRGFAWGGIGHFINRANSEAGMLAENVLPYAEGAVSGQGWIGETKGAFNKLGGVLEAATARFTGFKWAKGIQDSGAQPGGLFWDLEKDAPYQNPEYGKASNYQRGRVRQVAYDAQGNATPFYQSGQVLKTSVTHERVPIGMGGVFRRIGYAQGRYVSTIGNNAADSITVDASNPTGQLDSENTMGLGDWMRHQVTRISSRGLSGTGQEMSGFAIRSVSGIGSYRVKGGGSKYGVMGLLREGAYGTPAGQNIDVMETREGIKNDPAWWQSAFNGILAVADTNENVKQAALRAGVYGLLDSNGEMPWTVENMPNIYKVVTNLLDFNSGFYTQNAQGQPVLSLPRMMMPTRSGAFGWSARASSEKLNILDKTLPGLSDMLLLHSGRTESAREMFYGAAYMFDDKVAASRQGKQNPLGSNDLTVNDKMLEDLRWRVGIISETNAKNGVTMKNSDVVMKALREFSESNKIDAKSGFIANVNGQRIRMPSLATTRHYASEKMMEPVVDDSDEDLQRGFLSKPSTAYGSAVGDMWLELIHPSAPTAEKINPAVEKYLRVTDKLASSGGVVKEARSAIVDQSFAGPYYADFGVDLNTIAINDQVLKKMYGDDPGKIEAVRKYLNSTDTPVVAWRDPMMKNQSIVLRLKHMSHYGDNLQVLDDPTFDKPIIHPKLASQFEGDVDSDALTAFLARHLNVNEIKDKQGIGTGKYFVNGYETAGGKTIEPMTDAEIEHVMASTSRRSGMGLKEWKGALDDWASWSTPDKLRDQMLKKASLAFGYKLDAEGQATGKGIFQLPYDAVQDIFASGKTSQGIMGVAYNTKRLMDIATGYSEVGSIAMSQAYQLALDKKAITPSMKLLFQYMNGFQKATSGVAPIMGMPMQKLAGGAQQAMDGIVRSLVLMNTETDEANDPDFSRASSVMNNLIPFLPESADKKAINEKLQGFESAYRQAIDGVTDTKMREKALGDFREGALGVIRQHALHSFANAKENSVLTLFRAGIDERSKGAGLAAQQAFGGLKGTLRNTIGLLGLKSPFDDPDVENDGDEDDAGQGKAGGFTRGMMAAFRNSFLAFGSDRATRAGLGIGGTGVDLDEKRASLPTGEYTNPVAGFSNAMLHGVSIQDWEGDALRGMEVMGKRDPRGLKAVASYLIGQASPFAKNENRPFLNSLDDFLDEELGYGKKTKANEPIITPQPVGGIGSGAPELLENKMAGVDAANMGLPEASPNNVTYNTSSQRILSQRHRRYRSTPEPIQNDIQAAEFAKQGLLHNINAAALKGPITDKTLQRLYAEEASQRAGYKRARELTLPEGGMPQALETLQKVLGGDASVPLSPLFNMLGDPGHTFGKDVKSVQEWKQGQSMMRPSALSGAVTRIEQVLANAGNLQGLSGEQQSLATEQLPKMLGALDEAAHAARKGTAGRMNYNAETGQYDFTPKESGAGKSGISYAGNAVSERAKGAYAKSDAVAAEIEKLGKAAGVSSEALGKQSDALNKNAKQFMDLGDKYQKWEGFKAKTQGGMSDEEYAATPAGQRYARNVGVLQRNEQGLDRKRAAIESGDFSGGRGGGRRGGGGGGQGGKAGGSDGDEFRTGVPAIDGMLKNGRLIGGLQMMYMSKMWSMFTDPMLQATFQGAQNEQQASGVLARTGYGLQKAGTATQGAGAFSGMNYDMQRQAAATWSPAIRGMSNLISDSGMGGLASIIAPTIGLAATGGMIGNMFGGPVGAAIGGIGGGVIGAVGGMISRDKYMKENPAYAAYERYKPLFNSVANGTSGEFGSQAEIDKAITNAISTNPSITEDEIKQLRTQLEADSQTNTKTQENSPEYRRAAKIYSAVTTGLTKSSMDALGGEDRRVAVADRIGQLMSSFGISEEGASQLVTSNQLYMGGGVAGESALYKLMQSGIDPTQAGGALAGIMGGSKVNLASQGGLLRALSALPGDQQAEMVALSQQFGQYGSAFKALGVGPRAISTGYNRSTGEQESTIDDQGLAELEASDPQRAEYWATSANIANERRKRGMKFTNPGTAKTQMGKGALTAGDFYGQMADSSAVSRSDQMAYQAISLGMTPTQVQQLSIAGGESPQAARFFQSAMSGNPLAMSIMGAKTGDESMVTMQTGGATGYTGLGINTSSIYNSSGQINSIVGQSFNRFSAPVQNALKGYTNSLGINYGGQWGLQDYMSDLSYKGTMASAGAAIASGQRNLAFLTGNGIQNYANMYTGQSLPWSTTGAVGQAFTAGRGMWAVQDDMTSLGRQQQMWGFDYSAMQRGQQAAQFGEQWNFNRAQTQKQYGWQQEDFAFQAKQRLMNRTFQQEDWGFQREQRQMNYGWQMEDFDDNIRYATGRQRKVMERQRKRATITENIEEDRQNTVENRQKKMWKEEDERVRTEQKRAADSFKTQLERMDMEKKHFNERMALEEMNAAKQKAWTMEKWALEDEMTQMERSKQKLDIEASIAAAGAQAGIAAKMKEAQDAMTEINRQEQINQGSLQTRMLTEARFWEAVGGYLSRLADWLAKGGKGNSPGFLNYGAGANGGGKGVIYDESGDAVGSGAPPPDAGGGGNGDMERPVTLATPSGAGRGASGNTSVEVTVMLDGKEISGQLTTRVADDLYYGRRR